MNGLTKAAADVLAERERQRQKWGDQHDDEHTNDLLAYGAVDYLLPGQAPMPSSWAYKSKVTDREPRRDQLVKGAALALAAVEQWDRASTHKPGCGLFIGNRPGGVPTCTCGVSASADQTFPGKTP
jgi:hypothetical protein